MQALRRTRFLARLVLAWFALSLGVAIASPLVKHAGVDVICSGGALKVVVQGGPGTPVQSHTLDCPLCAGIHAPPSAARFEMPSVPPLAHAVQSIPSAHIAAATTAPLPARGPPAVPFA